MGLKPILRNTTSFSALTLLVGSFDPQKPFPEMTYNVFSGTLNRTHFTSLPTNQPTYCKFFKCNFLYICASIDKIPSDILHHVVSLLSFLLGYTMEKAIETILELHNEIRNCSCHIIFSLRIISRS